MHFTDLRIYKISLQLAKEVEELMRSIQHHWDIVETKQVIRSSTSVPANIAEGFAKKSNQKEFARFLKIALGSSDETQHHFNALFIKRYIQREQFDVFNKNYKDLSIRILNTVNTIANNSGFDLN